MRAIAAFGLAVVALGGATFVQRVRAADLAYPPPPVFNEPDPQFEFGTGWYLRGDASFGPEDQPRLTADGFDAGHTDFGWGAGGGVGYRFTSGFRADVTADYLDPSHSSADIDGVAYRYGLQRYDALANIYFDLGTWYGLTPYVGAGVGAAVFNPTETATPLVANAVLPTRKPVSSTEFAWAAMAGVSYQFDPSIAIDLGYRHLDLGRFGTTIGPNTLNKHFTEEQVRVGVRYMLN